MNTRYFYCWYLGNTQVRGFNGQKYALEAIPKLMERSSLLGKTAAMPSKVTLCLNEEAFSIIGAGLFGYKRNNQQQNSKQMKGQHTSPQQNKADFISYEQINYIYRLTGDLDDIVVMFVVDSDKLANINLYKSKLFEKSSNNNIALHAFRFDSSDTAKKLDKYLNEFRVNFKANNVAKPHEQPSQQQQQQQRQSNDVAPREKRQTEQHMQKKNPTSDIKSNFVHSQYQKADPKTRVNNHFMQYSFEHSSSPRSPPTSPVPQPPKTIPPPPPPLPPPSLLGGLMQAVQASKLSRKSPSNGNRDNKPANSQSPSPRVSLVSDDVTNELKRKFNANKPLLFPPKDYNTVMRSKGKLDEADLRRSLNEQIVGKAAIERRPVYDQDDDQVLKTINENDDIESIGDDAISAIKFYDDIVNNLTIKNSAKNPNKNFYRYEPPLSTTSSPSPIYNEVKHNPLHVMDSNDFAKKNEKKIFKPLNALEKRPSLISSQASSSSKLNAVQTGFRSGEFAKLGNYAPKCINTGGNSETTDNGNKKQYDNMYKNKNIEYAMNMINESLEFDSLNHSLSNDDNLNNVSGSSNTNGFILKPNVYKILRHKTNESGSRMSIEKKQMSKKPGQKIQHANNAHNRNYTSINSSSDVYY